MHWVGPDVLSNQGQLLSYEVSHTVDDEWPPADDSEYPHRGRGEWVVALRAFEYPLRGGSERDAALRAFEGPLAHGVIGGF